MTSSIVTTDPPDGTLWRNLGTNLRLNWTRAANDINALQAATADVLLKTGGTMTGAFISANGTAALPSIGVGSTNKGLYHYSANVVGFSAGGVVIGGFFSAGVWVETASTYGTYYGSAATVNYANATAGFPTEFSGNRSRGTIASKSVVIQNDQVRADYARAWGGITWRSAGIQLYTVIAATPSETDMQTRWELYIAASGSGSATVFLRCEHATGLSIYGTNVFLDNNRLFRLRVYTVATLPAAGTAGRRAAVSDATAPTFLGTLVGGGAVNTPVHDNGAAWVSG